jgi:hypothetical protein
MATRLLSLLILPILLWVFSLTAPSAQRLEPDQVNLALRRTADRLLRASGDSTSRIVPIEQTNAYVWQVRIEQPFVYEALPDLLQSSLDMYGIRQSYQVAVRRCEDGLIDLGFHQKDVVADTAQVPCGGRTMPEGCHYVEIVFEGRQASNATLWLQILATLLSIGLISFVWWKYSKPAAPPPPTSPAPSESNDFLPFGNSNLDLANQIVTCNGQSQSLTYREAKLLHLLASNPNQLLDRDRILQEIWADEGILVSRSVDMFISRLRKKIADDPSVRIVAVHGVGYRLEVG